MKERPAIFILKVLALSIFLYILWYWKGESYYLSFFEDFLYHLSWALGIRKGGLPYPGYLLSNLIPFISFMLITRDIGFKRRILKLAIGVLILIGCQILLAIVVYLFFLDSLTPSPLYYKLSVLLYAFSQTLPFFLWVILAKRNLLNLFIPKKVLVTK